MIYETKNLRWVRDMRRFENNRNSGVWTMNDPYRENNLLQGEW